MSNRLCILVLTALLCGCSSHSNPTDAKIAALEARIKTLEHMQAETKSQLEKQSVDILSNSDRVNLAAKGVDDIY